MYWKYIRSVLKEQGRQEPQQDVGQSRNVLEIYYKCIKRARTLRSPARCRTIWKCIGNALKVH